MNTKKGLRALPHTRARGEHVLSAVNLRLHIACDRRMVNVA
jgi:hypothetical protein